MKAVIYARFSSDNQREESIDAQVRAIREYAQKHNILIVHVYADEARSATTDQRPQFQQMIHDSETGDWQAVIVHKLDRFSRDRYDSAFYKRQLTMHGVRLISVLENLDDSPESVILESVLEGMAEYYSKNLAREVMKGMKETALACKNTGGPPPYGYSFDADRRLVINPDEAPNVRLIFKLYNAGNGYKAILTALKSCGARTRTGKLFPAGSVREMLLNPKYAGIYTYNRRKSQIGHKHNNHAFKDPDQVIWIEGGCPAIVSKEEFDAASARMKSNGYKNNGGRYNAKRNYILSGVIHCGNCGLGMSGSSIRGGRCKHIYYYYICNGKKYKKNCKTKSINADTIEDLVLKLLCDNVLTEKNIHSAALEVSKEIKRSLDGKGDRVAEIRRELDGIDKKIGNMVCAIADGLYSPVIKTKMDELEHRRDQLNEQLAEQLDTGITDISISSIEKTIRGSADLRHATKLRQREIIERIVHDIRVFDDHVDVYVDVFRPPGKSLSPPSFEKQKTTKRKPLKSAVFFGYKTKKMDLQYGYDHRITKNAL